MGESTPDLVSRAVRLFTYLARAQQLRAKPVRSTQDYLREGAVHWIGSIPEHEAIHVTHRDGDPSSDLVLLVLDRVDKVAPPAPPESIRPWLSGDPEKASSQPRLLASIRTGDDWDDEQEAFVERRELLEDHLDVSQTFERWMATWRPWAEKERHDAPARDCYADLFATFVKATGHSEELELVLGTGLLSWKPSEAHPAVRRHAFTCQVGAAMDSSTGSLTFSIDESAVGLTSELDMLNPDVIPQRVTVHDIAEDAGVFGAHPFDRLEFADLARRLVNNLDAEGRYLDGTEIPTPGDDAVVSWTPAIILRPRSQRGLVQVFETIADQIKEADEVPVGLLPLLDPDRVPPASTDATPGAILEVDGEVFSPLPLNPVQRRILSRVDSHSQTLVQGPPGTGKTHTAAALLSHLLAQGKRVLVTAHTDRALQEVRGKLPEKIKPLAVSVIGTSRDEMAELKVAVETIARRSTEHDQAATEAEVERTLARVEDLRRQRQALGARLLDAREADVIARDHLGYHGTLAAIARRYEDERREHGWINAFVDVEPESSAPLTDAEAMRWLELLGDQSLAADAAETRMRLLDDRRLPVPEDFARMVSERAAAEHARAPLAGLLRHEDAAAIQAMPVTDRTVLQSNMRDIVGQFEALGHLRAGWAKDALSDVRHGSPQVWQDRARVLSGMLTDLMRQTEGLAPSTTVACDGGLGRFTALAQHLHSHLETHGRIKTNPDGTAKVGAFSPAAVKQARPLFESVQVNGHSPTSLVDLDQFIAYAEGSRLLDAMDKAWPASVVIPDEDTVHERAGWHRSQLDQLLRVLQLGQRLAQEETALARAGLHPPDWSDPEAAILYARIVDAAAADDRWRAADRPLAEVTQRIHAAGRWKDAAPCIGDLAVAVAEGDHEAYRRGRSRLTRLRAASTMIAERESVTSRVRSGAPRLAAAVVADPGSPHWDPTLGALTAAWDWSATGSWILSQDTTNTNDIQVQIATIESELRNCAESVAAHRAWGHAVGVGRLSPTSRADLTQYSQLVQKLGKGTGKYAAKRRAEIRVAMDRCRPSVPVWVMPIYRIAEQLRVEENMFDVVLVDEASQAGVEASFLQYLAPKIVVIGDDKQVSPAAVGVDQHELRELADQYLPDDRYKSTWHDPQRSLFDEALMRFGGQLTLVEHRRCVPEIIGFSNRIAYEPNGIRLIPVRQFGVDRLEPFKIVHHPEGFQTGTSGAVQNETEANALVARLRSCLNDPRYDGLTMGVISLVGKRQAQLMESKLLSEVSSEEWGARQLRVGDAADFQGSERDVMFLSMVSSAEPGRRMASLTRESYVQRFNVAVSRAKDQVWLFHSVSLEQLPNKEDVRHQLLDYAYGVSRRGRDLAPGESSVVPEDVLVPPFDSLFEQRVFNRIVDRGLTVVPQFSASGYVIDLVVVGASARLAVECDGDVWHGPEAYEQDLARQRELERCGWQFFRVRESAFYVNPASALADLWDLLEELQIRPAGWLTESLTDDAAPVLEDAVGSEASEELLDSDRRETDRDFSSIEEQLEARLGQPQAQGPATGGADDDQFDQASTDDVAQQALGGWSIDDGSDVESTSGGAVENPSAELDRRSRAVSPYTAYQGAVSPIAEASLADIAEGMVEIVRVEGPVTGDRLHTAYVRAAGGRRVGKQIAQELNRAVTRAVKSGHLVEDNPLRQAGIKPKTFRLPAQPQVIPRELGIRDLDQVPPTG